MTASLCSSVFLPAHPGTRGAKGDAGTAVEDGGAAESDGETEGGAAERKQEAAGGTGSSEEIQGAAGRGVTGAEVMNTPDVSLLVLLTGVSHHRSSAPPAGPCR